MKITDNKLIAWGTLVMAVAAVMSALVTVIVYEVTTAENVAHCARVIDQQELRLNSLDGHVAAIDGYLRGQREPIAGKDLISSK